METQRETDGQRNGERETNRLKRRKMDRNRYTGNGGKNDKQK